MCWYRQLHWFSYVCTQCEIFYLWGKKLKWKQQQNQLTCIHCCSMFTEGLWSWSRVDDARRQSGSWNWALCSVLYGNFILRLYLHLLCESFCWLNYLSKQIMNMIFFHLMYHVLYTFSCSISFKLLLLLWKGVSVDCKQHFEESLFGKLEVLIIHKRFTYQKQSRSYYTICIP